MFKMLMGVAVIARTFMSMLMVMRMTAVIVVGGVGG